MGSFPHSLPLAPATIAASKTPPQSAHRTKTKAMLSNKKQQPFCWFCFFGVGGGVWGTTFVWGRGGPRFFFAKGNERNCSSPFTPQGVPSTSAQNAAFSAALGACGEAALWRRAVQLLERLGATRLVFVFFLVCVCAFFFWRGGEGGGESVGGGLFCCCYVFGGRWGWGGGEFLDVLGGGEFLDDTLPQCNMRPARVLEDHNLLLLWMVALFSASNRTSCFFAIFHK